MNPFKYIKNNPKKSIFGTLVCGYVGNWINGLHKDHIFRHAICRKIATTGTEKVNWFYHPKVITVFLNPVANNGKAVKLFEKNAAPLLHLSGCDVKVIRLDYEGQAKQLMSVLEKTDMVVAAGGNGTLSEVVTGLLRRQDSQKWADVPVGVIPLGETNTLCRQLTKGYEPSNYEQWIMNATADLLKNNSRAVDVMKITGENGKSVYALSDIRWGSYSDAYGRTSKYWFWGPLKKYMTFVFASYKSKIQTAREFELKYTGPEPVIEQVTSTAVVNNALNPIVPIFSQMFSWGWRLITGSSSTSMSEPLDITSKEEELKEKTFDNSLQSQTLEFSAFVNTHDPAVQRTEAAASISIENEEFSVANFIKNGPKRFSSERPQSVNVKTELNAGSFQIIPIKSEDSWFKIDNENYEAMECSVQVIPNRIKMVCSPPEETEHNH